MPGSSDWIPRSEAVLRTFSTDFSTAINSDPTAFGLDLAQTSAFDALNTAWVNAYLAATNPATRGNLTIQNKDDAKAAMLPELRRLGMFIQNRPATTNDQRITLGLTVKDGEPSPAPIPSTQPVMHIESVTGRTIILRLRDSATPTSNARPEGVEGANIMYHVGETVPSSASEWVFGAMAGRPLSTLIIPSSVPAGSKVWISAFWFNTRKQTGPFATPLYTNISESVQQAA